MTPAPPSRAEQSAALRKELMQEAKHPSCWYATSKNQRANGDKLKCGLYQKEEV